MCFHISTITYPIQIPYYGIHFFIIDYGHCIRILCIFALLTRLLGYIFSQKRTSPSTKSHHPYVYESRSLYIATKCKEILDSIPLQCL